MRPITRGPHPQNGESLFEFENYRYVRGHLIERLGQYCSYCEAPMPSSLAVEHILPKGAQGLSEEERRRRELDWDNFLLACSNCNSTKGDRNLSRKDCLWPDMDNTCLALRYSEGGLVSPAEELTEEIQKLAQRLIKLVGLDRIPKEEPFGQREANDRRWDNRRKAWDKAVLKRSQLAKNGNATFRETIVELAQATGYWSVWMTVFCDDEDMLKRLIEAFPGTCSTCFDERCRPRPRPNGRI